jgi:F0F1-type ATP synthase assembly protein I
LGGWNNFGRVEHFRVFFLSGLIILVFLFLIFKPDPSSLFFSSLKERVFYLNVPRGTFTQDPFLGVGAGQSVLVMQKFYPQNLEFWEYQPVHNVFLLILSELGSVGLILFIWWLYKLFQKIPHPNPLLRKERERIVPRGTSHSSSPYQGEELKEGLKERERKNRSNILSNNNIYLSSIIASQYFKGILLGFIFIMLFDHYLWDIQQGSLLLWIVAGFVAGINKIKQEIK